MEYSCQVVLQQAKKPVQQEIQWDFSSKETSKEEQEKRFRKQGGKKMGDIKRLTNSTRGQITKQY